MKTQIHRNSYQRCVLNVKKNVDFDVEKFKIKILFYFRSENSKTENVLKGQRGSSFWRLIKNIEQKFQTFQISNESYNTLTPY